jgi:hypothetical protein
MWDRFPADLPLIVCFSQFLYHRAQLPGRIRAQARDDAIEEDDQGHERDEVGPEEPRRSKRPDGGGDEEHNEGSEERSQD